VILRVRILERLTVLTGLSFQKRHEFASNEDGEGQNNETLWSW
jgi:hypothetical protein